MRSSEPSNTEKLKIPAEIERAIEQRIENYLVDWLKGLDRHFGEVTDEETLKKIAKGESVEGGGEDKGWTSPDWGKDK